MYKNEGVINRWNEASEALAANAVCFLINGQEKNCAEFLCKLSFSQLMSIRDSLLASNSHLTNRNHEIIIKAIRGITLSDPSLCPELADYLINFV